jgi:guanylate kinase
VHTGGPLLVVLTGPSAAGKDTVLSRLKGSAASSLRNHCDYTSPRPTERDGVDYYFVALEEFRRMVAEDELLNTQWSTATSRVPKAAVRSAPERGRTC